MQWKRNFDAGTTHLTCILLLFVPLALAGCGGDGESSQIASAAPPCPATPEAVYDILFEDPFLPVCPDSSGSGAFGSWQVDAHGLPSYRYTINHREDPRASYVTSWGESRDHWHQLGNDAISATAHNEGYIQLWDWTRGGKCVNRYQPSQSNFSGGSRFLKSGEHVWNTLYNPDAFPTTERVLGIGYFLKESVHQGLRVRERTYAPFAAIQWLSRRQRSVTSHPLPRSSSCTNTGISTSTNF